MDEEGQFAALAEARRAAGDEWGYVTADARGRRFVWRLLMEQCAIEASNFSNDALMQAYAQGRRDVGLAVKAAFLAFDKGVYWQMEEENR